MDVIDYDEMVWNEPADGTRVTVACVRCNGPIEVEYDSGEPTTRDHPGAPATWYTVDEMGGPCEHFGSYSRDEEAEFYVAVDRTAYSSEA